MSRRSSRRRRWRWDCQLNGSCRTHCGSGGAARYTMPWETSKSSSGGGDGSHLLFTTISGTPQNKPGGCHSEWRMTWQRCTTPRGLCRGGLGACALIWFWFCSPPGAGGGGHSCAAPLRTRWLRFHMHLGSSGLWDPDCVQSSTRVAPCRNLALLKVQR